MRKLLLVFIFMSSLLIAQKQNVRNEINIPNITGYLTLKCDFHMHTVFSDGNVWPTHRILEAWREGLDVIALTDHIEYQPHKKDVNTDLNRPYEISKGTAENVDIILIKGSEITRNNPPGHMNAIFLNDAEALRKEEFMDSFKEAQKQKAFVFWNHPGWRLPNEIPVWSDMHSDLLNQGLFQGIEVVNEFSYYPLAFQWALEKGLTIMGNSDVHDPTDYAYDFHNEKRVITLVFAKEKSEEAVKEALLNRRTAVLFKNQIIGEKQFSSEIFNNSVKLVDSDLRFNGNKKVNLQLHNNSDIDFDITFIQYGKEIFEFPVEVKVPAQKTILVPVKLNNSSAKYTSYKIPVRVNNIFIGPEEKLLTTIEVNFME